MTLKHGEALDENGNLYRVNLRTAKATDRFICSGKNDVFLPTFTYHGFRYVQIEGIAFEDIRLEDYQACVLHSDLKQSGTFECGNEKINQLWNNIFWTQRGNFLDVPTDCPQRDERLAYTGDGQIFAPSAVYNQYAKRFYEKWLRDIAVEQTDEFGVPMSVPNILGNAPAIAIWHDAATIVPWLLWETYGDIEVLENQFQSMKACVDYTTSQVSNNGLLMSGQQLGDWVALDMEKGPMRPRTEEMLNLSPDEKTGSTDVYYIANLYYLNSIDILSKAAVVLGYQQEAQNYRETYDDVMRKIRQEYLTPAGRLISETQTGCALTLHFGIVPESQRKSVLATLIKNIQKHKNHLTTGFVGTQFLCRVLSDNDQHELAGKIFLQEDCPSWLYSVNLGATTIWELWDGVNPDGSFNKYEMNSLNQYAFASIGEWIYRNLGGLESLTPGYQESLIRPRLIKGIPWVKTALETNYGLLACELTCKENRYIVDLIIPANTQARVDLPEKELFTLGSGIYHYEYETSSSFESEIYSYDSKLHEILDTTKGATLFEQYFSEMLENPMFLQFAAERSLLEVQSYMPEEAQPVFDLILAEVNQEARKELVKEK